MSRSPETDFRSRRFAGALAHFLVIVIIFILPELVLDISMPHRRGAVLFPGFYVKNLIFIAVFYFNYSFVINRTLARGVHRSIGRFFAWNLLAIVVALTLCWLMSNFFFKSRHHNNSSGWINWRLTYFIIRDGVMILLTIALAVALRISTMWKDLQSRQQEMLANQRSTELDNLKTQLNPHFLFNTLNTIYALIAIDSGDAQRAVHRLSTLLRYMLYENEEMVPLRREVEFIENYVALMKLRMSGRVVNILIDIETSAEAMVAPLLFIPLVENAFKFLNTERRRATTRRFPSLSVPIKIKWYALPKTHIPLTPRDSQVERQVSVWRICADG